MKKLAIFVEGNTELVFVENLVIEIAGFHNVSIARHVLHGGKILPLYSTGVPPENAEFHVLITNCESDGKVKPAILERMPSLHSQGYEMVLGLRDAYPNKRADLQKLQEGLLEGLDELQVSTHIVLAVMEIEAWFIGEWTHFQKINALLTPDFIKFHHQFDVENENPEHLDAPATKLGQIYESVGKSYKKKDRDAKAVAARLDYGMLYIATRSSMPSLAEFLDCLDHFFYPASA